MDNTFSNNALTSLDNGKVRIKQTERAAIQAPKLNGKTVFVTNKPYQVVDGCVKITRDTIKDSKCDSNANSEPEKLINSINKIDEEIDELVKNFSKSKPKKKRNKKGKNKKAKKYKESVNQILATKNNRLSNMLTEMLKYKERILVINDEVWIYQLDNGTYMLCQSKRVAAKLRSLLSKDSRYKVTIKDYEEAYKQLLINEELFSDKKFFANKPYVNCKNGVVEVLTGKLLPHSHKYKFNQCIQAEYKPGADCSKFLSYVDIITGGDKKLKRLIRVMLGYIFSHYNNAKVVFLLYGKGNTGKSIICRVVKEIAGKEYTANIDIAKLSDPVWAAKLENVFINIVPDLGNGILKDTGAFKSLVSPTDSLTVKNLYENPREMEGTPKMLMSANHLIELGGNTSIEDAEAVFNRILYIPFQNEGFSGENDNKNFIDEVLEEKDAIFTWSIKGLREYIENGCQFPDCILSDEVKAENMAKYCPEKIFTERCIKFEDGSFESSEFVRDVFMDFFFFFNISKVGNIIRYLTNNYHLRTDKRRITLDGQTKKTENPIAIICGIRIKNKYR